MSIGRVSQSNIPSNSVSHQNSVRDTSRTTSSTGEAFARYVSRHLGNPQESPIAAHPSPQTALPDTPTLPHHLRSNVTGPNTPTINLPPAGPSVGGGNSSHVSVSSQCWTPVRKIVPDQAKCAEQLEQQTSPTTPTWKGHRPEVSITITDSSRNSNADTIGPPNSAILGSDIIRANSGDSRHPRIITKQYTGPKRFSESTEGRFSTFSPTPRDSMLSPPSARSPHFSFTTPSSRASYDNLEVVYEGDTAKPEKSRSRAPSRKPSGLDRRNTFGPRPFSSLKSASHFDQGMDLSDGPTLASPPGLSPRVRFPSSPSGPRPLPGVTDSFRSPALSSSPSWPPPPYNGSD